MTRASSGPFDSKWGPPSYPRLWRLLSGTLKGRTRISPEYLTGFSYGRIVGRVFLILLWEPVYSQFFYRCVHCNFNILHPSDKLQAFFCPRVFFSFKFASSIFLSQEVYLYTRVKNLTMLFGMKNFNTLFEDLWHRDNQKLLVSFRIFRTSIASHSTFVTKLISPLSNIK